MSCAATLRQSGGSIILSIPRSIARAMAVEAGSVVESTLKEWRKLAPPIREQFKKKLATCP